MQDLEYFNAITAQLEDGGYEALLYHLQHEVDIRDFDPSHVPKTARCKSRFDSQVVASMRSSRWSVTRVVCPMRWMLTQRLRSPAVQQDGKGFDHWLNHEGRRTCAAWVSSMVKHILNERLGM